jgi:hypothetical protein
MRARLVAVRFLKRLVPALCWLLTAGLCHATEGIEILLDASTEMWEPFQNGTPRVVAVRDAINAFAVSPEVSARGIEIGLRTVGGRTDILDDLGCEDADVVIPRGPVDPSHWSAVLFDLDPRGSRALVHAVEETVDSLAAAEGENRIVILTSGKDQCQRQIAAALKQISEKDLGIRIRVIGLAIDGALASSLLVSTPTKNVNNPDDLIDVLRWAILGADVAPTRPEWLELRITRGDNPVTNATLYFPGPADGEEISAEVKDGSARVRIVPGLHRARLEGAELGSIELSGIVNDPNGRALDFKLVDLPPITFEVDPERPLAGGEAYVQYWGSTAGNNWLGVAVAGAAAGDFIVRVPAPEAEGLVTLGLPDAPNDVELQLTREAGSGVVQLLGRFPFETTRRKVSIEAPPQVENGDPLELQISGETLPGDHITLAGKADELSEYILCAPVAGREEFAVTAPAVAGEYVIRYLTGQGRMLARSNLDVFEILATLEGPSEVGPGAEFTVAWTGPGTEQDFLSIAAAGDVDEQYVSFAPTADGNPTLLRAPRALGDYEVRYVRGTDGEVLARHRLVVATVEITLHVPDVVGAGTRFEVEWTGTAEDGDFIAVASPGSGVKNHLDWSFTNLGSPLTLAAPFEPGRYIVRYVSGTERKVIARAPLQVR